MFDFHLGGGLSVSSDVLRSPLVVLGKPGQGKTVFLLQFALELIRNAQSGVLYDPYGDLAKNIREKVTSEEAKIRVRFLTQTEFLAEKPAASKKLFTVVSGDVISDGSATTRPIAQQVVQKAFEVLTVEDWLIVDQACDIANAELFGKYLLQGNGPKVVASDTTLIHLSAQQREMLFTAAVQWAVYKTQNIDGTWIEKYLSAPTAKQIAAMEQYHFYWIDDKKPTYTTGAWPIEAI